MLNGFDLPKIAAAAERYGITAPDGARDAADLAAAATQIEAAIDAAPDRGALLAAATATNAAKTVDALAALPGRDTRRQAARELAAEAGLRRTAAWDADVPRLLAQFAPPFDAAAARFTATVTDLGGTLDANAAVANGQGEALAAARTAAATLVDLAGIRDALAAAVKADAPSIPWDRLTRCLTVPSDRAVARSIPLATAGLSPLAAEWWAAVLQVEGVAIEWHTPEQQERIIAARKTGTARS